MIIREATQNDVSGIARVHVDTWLTTYKGIIPDEYLANLSYEKKASSWNQIINKASQKSNFTFVAENELEHIIGFANGGLERENDSIYQGELNAIYILESYQRKRVGQTLFRAVVEKLDLLNIYSMMVWVLADNSACQFYEKLGGEKIREKQIERGGKKLIEVAYGWLNIEGLASRRSLY